MKFCCPAVACGEDRACPQANMTGLNAWHVVKTVDCVAGKEIEQTVVDHCLGSSRPFFCRLEYKMQHAVEAFAL